MRWVRPVDTTKGTNGYEILGSYKTSYNKGEVFDTSNFLVKMYFKDGGTMIDSIKANAIKSFDNETAGTYNPWFNYNGVKITLNEVKVK